MWPMVSATRASPFTAVVSGEESFTTSLPFPVPLAPARLLDDLA